MSEIKNLRDAIYSENIQDIQKLLLNIQINTAYNEIGCVILLF